MNTEPDQTLHFTLTIDAQEIRVSYTPNRFTTFPVGQFRFYSPFNPRRRIPVSETGYLSHFAAMADIEAAPGPQEYARALVSALMSRKTKHELADDDEDDQLALF